MESFLTNGGHRHCRLMKLKKDCGPVSDFVSEVEGCIKCDRRFDCRSPVLPQFVDMSKYNGFMFVGRDPSVLEDKSGKIFNVKSPHVKILGKYFKALGVSRDSSYLTNSVFCHGFENRKPNWSEVYMCSYYKLSEFSILGDRLKHVVLMGDDACRQFIGAGESIVKHLGMRYILDIYGREVSVVIVNHPGYLLLQRGLMKETLEILEDYRDKYVKI